MLSPLLNERLQVVASPTENDMFSVSDSVYLACVLTLGYSAVGAGAGQSISYASEASPSEKNSSGHVLEAMTRVNAAVFPYPSQAWWRQSGSMRRQRPLAVERGL